MKNLFLSAILLLSFGCTNSDDLSNNNAATTEEKELIGTGKIVGYSKCYNTEKNSTSLGIFIITESRDSLLTFNIPLSFFDLDTNQLEFGVYGIDGDSVSFSYKKAEAGEIKYDFLCPQNAMDLGFPYPVENFLQVIIEHIDKIDHVEKNENVSSPSINGKWKVIEENDAWDYHLIRPVDYYRVWEFFPDRTVRYYHNSDNIDDQLKTYQLKSDSLYIYYDDIKEGCCTHIYTCRFIDEENNKIQIEYLQGNSADIPKPSLWIYERVTEVNEQDTTVLPPKVNEQDTTILPPKVNEQDTTILPPKVNEQDTTILPPKVNEQDTTVLPPKVNEQDTTVLPPKVNEQDTTIILPPCELKTSFFREIEYEATILKKRPEGEFFSPSPCIFGIESGSPYLYIKVDMLVLGKICNFPQYAYEWDIPEEGLPVILSGKAYSYDQFYPGDRLIYYLELLTIKKK
jgi:hypothetical protein